MSAAGSAGPTRGSAAMASVAAPPSSVTGSTKDSSRDAATASKSSGRPSVAPGRRVRLTVSRIDPWSSMKISFLLSVALGIAGVIAVGVLWTILSGWGVFADVDRIIGEILGNSEQFTILDYVGFGRVVSLAIVIGVIDVVLMTAIATLTAILYNLCSSLVGGVELTLSDD